MGCVTRCLRVALALLVIASAACSAGARMPDRAPDVHGVVALTRTGEAVLHGSSDPYFEGMSLERGGPDVAGLGGDRAELGAGDEVEVWVAGPCAESFPVQCEIDAVRVTG